jgi:hypothetical protein
MHYATKAYMECEGKHHCYHTKDLRGPGVSAQTYNSISISTMMHKTHVVSSVKTSYILISQKQTQTRILEHISAAASCHNLLFPLSCWRFFPAWPYVPAYKQCMCRKRYIVLFTPFKHEFDTLPPILTSWLLQGLLSPLHSFFHSRFWLATPILCDAFSYPVSLHNQPPFLFHSLHWWRSQHIPLKLW